MAVFDRKFIAATLLVAVVGTASVDAAGVTLNICNADGTNNGTAVTQEFTSGTKVCTAGKKHSSSYTVPAKTIECVKETSTCVGFTGYKTTDCSGTAQPESFMVCNKCQMMGSSSSLKLGCSEGSSTASLKIYTAAADCTGSETSKDITDACSNPMGDGGAKVTSAGFKCNTIKSYSHEGVACDSAMKTGSDSYLIQDKCNAMFKFSCPADTKDSVDSASAASLLAAAAAVILAVVA